MNDYQLTCCSTADRTEEFFQERGIAYVCFHFTMDGVEYPDDLGKSVPADEFYRRISAGSQPVTSQVNTEEYEAFWEPFLAEGKDIFHVTLSSGISGTINSANAARDTLLEKYPGRRIIVLDSLGASAGYGMFMEYLADKRDEGMDIDQLYEWGLANRLLLHHWFFSTDLTSYYRGGRISRSSAAIGTILGICPLMNMDDEGHLVPRRNVRTKKKVIQEIVGEMEAHAQGGREYNGKCRLSMSACRPDAEKVVSLIEERFPHLRGKIGIDNVGGVIGAHTGPGTVALYFMGDRRTK